MSTYYNEIDPFAAAWLRELMKARLISDGEVDTRSIVDVRPDDLRGFTRCHFFAGIGGWDHALTLAGWPADRAVWTGSCPCQPWSVAGAGGGANDPRHLWPAWFPLIRECRPRAIFGEQTASTDGEYWLDLVSVDLEGADYAIGAFDLPAAGVGAPHGRQRFYFVADDHGARRGHESRLQRSGDGEGVGAQQGKGRAGAHGAAGDVADADSDGRREDAGAIRGSASTGIPTAKRKVKRRAGVEERNAVDSRADASDLGHTNQLGRERRPRFEEPADSKAERTQKEHHARRPNVVGGLGDANVTGLEGHAGHGDVARADGQAGLYEEFAGSTPAAGPTRGFWRPCEWVQCVEPGGAIKARPVEPGTFPLAHGIPARVGRLRGYGNAIVPQVAAEVIAAYLELDR